MFCHSLPLNLQKPHSKILFTLILGNNYGLNFTTDYSYFCLSGCASSDRSIAVEKNIVKDFYDCLMKVKITVVNHGGKFWDFDYQTLKTGRPLNFLK